MCDVAIHISAPVLAQVIAQLHHAAILLKAHAGTVVVCALILRCYGRGEPTASHLVGCLSLNGTPAAGTQVYVGSHAVLFHLTRHDVQHAAHSVRAIEHGGWTTEHLHALCHQCLV